MNNEINLSFTPWQAVAFILTFVGIVSIILVTIYLIGVLREAKKTLQQSRAVMMNVNDILEDVQATKLLILNRLAEVKRMTDVVRRFKDIKQKREARKYKKLKKEGEI